MTITVLLTGFGPFPGTPVNPTGPLVEALARRQTPGVRRVAHIFETAYAAVDRELPALLARETPQALIMFGVATRRLTICVETRAHNKRTSGLPDAGGLLPSEPIIAAGAERSLPLRAPAATLARAARAAGVPARISNDAGGYLCNYLCWRAAEACRADSALALATFVHVPPTGTLRTASGEPITLDDLIDAGEAIVGAALKTLVQHQGPLTG